MRRYASTNRIKQPPPIQDDEEGLLYDENQGFNVSPRHRQKKSKFAPQKSKYIQHFPGGYKIESEVPSGTPVPFQSPPMAPYGNPYPYFGMSSPYQGNPYMGSPYMGSPYQGSPYMGSAYNYSGSPYH